MPDPWTIIPQRAFSAGMFHGVARHLIPPNGVFHTLNGFYDEDGSIYRRGGSTYHSSNGLGTAGLRWLWDGQLAGGQRTLVASTTNWGTLAADDATIIDLGAGGLAGPTRASVVGGLLFIGGGTVYGGSRKTADYQTGTISGTAGQTTITGTGTAWSANVDAGMILKIGAEPLHVVQAVNSDTSITLAEPLVANASGAYTLKRFETAANHGAPTSEVYATIADRLIAGVGDTVSFSAERDPATGAFRTGSWDPTDNHRLPGATVLGLEPLRDTMMVFTTEGVHAITNMAFDLTDADGNIQQGLERVNSDLLVWGKEGIATFGNLLMVPCVDHVYTLGIAQGPQIVSRAVAAMYQSYVRAGYRPGVASVYRGHYLLPILDSSNAAVDMFAFRVDRPVDTPLGVVFPASHVQGHAGNVTALSTRVASGPARSPGLMAASRASGSRVLRLGPMWEPSATNPNDADGSTHIWELETRDFITGGEDLNTVRRLRVRYELVDAANDNPKITALYSVGFEVTPTPKWNAVNWNQFLWGDTHDAEFTLLSGQAPEDPGGRYPYKWRLRSRTRYIRARLRCQYPAASLKLRSIEWWVRPSGLSR